jgi:branched-chain amino acid transport system ATP-binding protein
VQEDAHSRPVLRLDGVVRRFGGLTAVDGVSLTLGPRQRLAVIGPNGAGKTTLFRLIAGDMRASEGRIELFGRDVTGLPAHRRARLGLSRTFQVTNLFSGLSVLDNVRLAAQAREPSRWRFWAPVRASDRAGAAAMAVLERVGLGSRVADRVADLSHGEQRQLEVALALATEPRLLLLDEPAAGLSAGERTRLRDLLDSLPPSLPVVLIEHDMTLALSLADEVLCLHNGRPIAHGPPGQVRADATVQAVYLGRAVDA